MAKPKSRVPDKSRNMVLADVPDIRDRMYEPTLRPLLGKLNPESLPILDQGQEGACTGFALATVVHALLRRNAFFADREKIQVSPYMLYAMAKRHDEWRGENYEGSSLRGALRGWYNNGACRLNLWSSIATKELTLEAAKNAREVTLGAYFRLRPSLVDFHAALTEVGAVYCSATVHDRWDAPARQGREKLATILPDNSDAGLHAFAIVGYTREGFIVQNSWGKSWGTGGRAIWRYEDWSINLEDAWVVQLALPTPQVVPTATKAGSGNAARLWSFTRPRPARTEIAGHFVHVDDGKYSPKHPYWSTQEDVEITARNLAASDKYQHLLFYAHGGLNDPDAAATRVAAMKDVFKKNGIYPYSVLYDTGLVETLKDIIVGRGDGIRARTGGFTDFTDSLLEAALRAPGKALWDEMKRDAANPFVGENDGTRALRAFRDALGARLARGDIKLHLIGHSTGAILMGHFLAALDRIVQPNKFRIASCSLMAPACTIEYYKRNYRPRVRGDATCVIDSMAIYNLTDAAERDDNVAAIYRKSLLYLVSNAFEEEAHAPLLGMETACTAARIAADPIDLRYAAPDSEFSRSTKHGGFDNDVTTMNRVLRSVLGKTPTVPFTKNDLDY